MEVCDLLGHSSVTVAERYAHLAESALQGAVQPRPGRRSRRQVDHDPGHDCATHHRG